MTILNLLFPNKPWLFKKTITDDIFGLMWFKKQENSEFDHYQGHFIFRPTKSEIDIFIDSDRNGIEPRQKTFFKEIDTRYFESIEKSKRPIEEFLNKKNNQYIKIVDFDKEFQLFAISISRIPSQKWSFSFSSEKFAIYGLTVKFKNWDIEDIS